jgi:metal-responsive CopG/Arc/MetJ family transcriptional regulator
MKTAISLSDSLFHSADTLARRLGISRSRLFATAVEEFVAKHRSEKITERLNSIYSSDPSRIEPPLRRAQKRVVSRAEW